MNLQTESNKVLYNISYHFSKKNVDDKSARLTLRKRINGTVREGM